LDDIFVAYQPALLSLGVLCLAVMLQSVMCPFLAFTEKGRQKPGQISGGPDQLGFRVVRTYVNSTENLPVFIGVLIFAFIAGVSPYWINLLAGVHVAARLLFWLVYYSKLGAKTPGPRSILYIIGMTANKVLVGIAFVSLF